MYLFCGIGSTTFAATKQDVIKAINKTYDVGDEKYRLPQNIIDKGEEYLNKKNLSSEQYDKILLCIDNAVALARELGTTDFSSVSDEDLKRAVRIIAEAATSAEVDLQKKIQQSGDFIAENTNIDIDKIPVTSKQPLSGENKPEVVIDNIKKEEIEVTPEVSRKKKDEPKDNISPLEVKDKIEEPLTKNDSGDNTSGDNIELGNSSGEEDLAKNNQEFLDVWLDDFVEKKEQEAMVAVNKILVIDIVLLLTFILIFYLILRMKKYKLLKVILVFVVSILLLASIAVLILLVFWPNKIKFFIELYFIIF